MRQNCIRFAYSMVNPVPFLLLLVVYGVPTYHIHSTIVATHSLLIYDRKRLQKEFDLAHVSKRVIFISAPPLPNPTTTKSLATNFFTTFWVKEQEEEWRLTGKCLSLKIYATNFVECGKLLFKLRHCRLNNLKEGNK